MPDIKKKPRKISCLPCRTKKARCDEQRPHCSRCVRNNREHLCIYPKPKTFGRPPKNPNLHKNKDTPVKPTSSTSYKPFQQFVFENYDRSSPPAEIISRHTMHAPQRFIRYNNQQLDIEKIYQVYVTRAITLRLKLPHYHTIPHFKLKTLEQLHTFLTTCMVNITLKRTCEFMNIHSFMDPELTMSAFMKDDGMHAFFFKAESQFPISPIHTIPTYQAIQLINYFFDHYPYHILLNKTKLLQQYWNDTVEPLLLCVIYGVATFALEHSLNGRDMYRNPYLDYAYIIMEKFFTSKTTKKTTALGNYQAVVILGVFEILFGLPKHGMTILTLSYMMAADLGIFNHSDIVTDGVLHQASIDYKSKPNHSTQSLDAVDKELLINTYWAALRCTAYGCLELGLYVRDTLLFHGQPFPAASGSTSASFQLDSAHNNISLSSGHLVESYHTDMVLTYFSSKLFACLPKTEFNLFGGRAFAGPPPSDREQKYFKDHGIVVHYSRYTAYEPSNNFVVESRIRFVLTDFADFIAQEKHHWSFEQSYTIETTYYLYTIYFSFIKSINNISPLRYHQIPADLNLMDPRTRTRLTSLQPATIQLIHLLKTFLQEIEDRKLYNPADEFTLLDKVTYTALLPYSLMSTVLETVVQLSIYHYRLGLDTINQIQSIQDLIKHPLFWIPQQQAVTKLIDTQLQEFIEVNQIPVVKEDPMFFMEESSPIDPITAATASMNLQDLDSILNSFDGLY